MKKLLLLIALFFIVPMVAQEEALIVIDCPDESAVDFTFTTSSNSTTWGPTRVTNPGAPTEWAATGGITIAPSSYPGDTYPTWSFSSNIGNAEVTVSGALNVTDFRFQSVDITAFTVHNNLPNLEVFEVKLMPALSIADVTNLPGLKTLVLRDNNISFVSLATNVILESLYLYGNNLTTIDISMNPLLSVVNLTNNLLTTSALDALIINLDAGGISNGNLSLANNPSTPSSVVYNSFQNLLLKGWNIDIVSPSAPTTPGDENEATLFSFRIETGNLNRVLFDASEDITGLTSQGFTVIGKSVSSLTVDQDGLGGYVTVASDFSYWDNNSIKLDGGNGIIDDFTLEYIDNNIVLAEGTTQVIYVNIAAAGLNNGTNETNAYTNLQTAVTAATGGSKIWVKAGNYGTQRVTSETYLANPDYPIVIEGYKTTPGDITENYFTYTENGVNEFDSSEMPLFVGSSRENGLTWWSFGYNSYYILRNLQITDYNKGIRVQRSSGMEFERVNMTRFGESVADGGIAFSFPGTTEAPDSHRMRLRECVALDASLDLVQLYGSHYLIEDCYVANQSYDAGEPDGLSTDYYYAIKGSSGIIIGSTAFRDTPGGLGHGGHGFDLKTASNDFTDDTWVVYNNLVDNCLALNIGQGYTARHNHVRYNVYKNSESHADVINRRTPNDDWIYTGGIAFIDGGSYNIFENMYLHDMDNAVAYLQTTGEHDPEPGYGSAQHHSTIRNSVIDNVRYVFSGRNVHTSATSSQYENKFYNNTITTALWMYWIKPNNPFNWDTTNIAVNNIIEGVATKDLPTSLNTDGWQFDNTVIANSWTNSLGTNSINIDPTLNILYQPQAAFNTINVPKIAGVNHDYKGLKRKGITTAGAVLHVNELLDITEAVSPVLSNYIIYNGTPTQIHFDASGDVTGLTSAGFISSYSEKLVTGVTIDGDGLGGYLTLSIAFDFWDNSTIRLESGDGTINDFTLQYVQNTIDEPTSSGTIYYVKTGGSNASNGLTEGTAWETLNYASAQLIAGDILYVQKGTYTDDQFELLASGTPTNPIRIIGYDTTINDAILLDRTLGKTFDSNDLPLLWGEHFNFNEKTNVIVKNIQVSPNNRSDVGDDRFAFDLDHAENIYLYNTYVQQAKTAYWTFTTGIASKLRIRRGFSQNNGHAGTQLAMDHGLLEDLIVGTSDVTHQDYYINILGTPDGNASIVKDCQIYRNAFDTHSGHGYSMKGDQYNNNGYKIEYSLNQDCTIVNGGSALELRHSVVRYNVVRNLVATWDGSNDDRWSFTGIQVTSAIDNIVENSYFEAEYGVRWVASIEDEATNDAGNGNKFINCVWDNNGEQNYWSFEGYGDVTGPNGLYRYPINNEFINCTIYGGTGSLFWNGRNDGYSGSGNKIINSIIIDATDKQDGGYTVGWSFESSLFWNTFTPEGISPITGVDPLLNVNFEPLASFSLLKVNRYAGVLYDKRERERDYVTTVGAVTHDEEVLIGATFDTPVLTDFALSNSNTSRLTFNATGDVTGLSTIGFAITGKTISSITIDGDGLGGYFTVSTPFTYWSNHTIRLGNINSAPINNGIINDFELQYVTNEIVEPSASTDRYVTVAGAGSHNGTLGNEWTLSEALAQAQSGNHVHIKKGDYGSGSYTISNSGTVGSPIIFEGYDVSPEDYPTLVRTPTTVLDASSMPYINGTGSSNGLHINGNSYIIVRSLIVYDFEYGIRLGGAPTGVILDNVYARKATQASIDMLESGSTEIRVINSYASDALGQGLKISGERNMLDNVYVSSNGTVHMDYYISFKGSSVYKNEGIIRNCTVVRDPLTGHTGHGISLRGNGTPVENVLVENSTIDYVGSAIELRTDLVQYCVIRNVTVNNHKETDGTYQAIRITGGQNNVLDGVINIDSEFFVQFLGSVESEEYGVIPIDAGNNNIFKNCKSYNTGTFDPVYLIYLRDDIKENSWRVPNNNTFINCTFENYDNLTFYENAPTSGVGNRFINCILTEISNEDLRDPSNWAFEYTNTWDVWTANGAAIPGTGNFSFDPQLDASLVPQGTFSELVVPREDRVKYDINDIERAVLTTVGAVTHGDESIIVVTENPILSDFRIDANYKDRIYFTSSTSIDATNSTGFTLWETPNITGISINGTALTGHYLILDIDMSIFSNPLVEYDGGNVTNAFGPLLKMRLQRVTNYLDEPIPLVNYYVIGSVTTSGNGLSEGTAFKTIQEGLNQLSAGDKLWIKAGIYVGTTSMGATQDGTITNPIHIEGYKNTPGDAGELVRSKTMSFDSAEMPLINGGTDGLNFDNSHYIIVKNLQLEGHSEDALGVDNVSFALIKNVYMSGGVSGMSVNNNTSGVNGSFGHIRVDRSFFRNGSGRGARLQGRNCSFLNTWAVSTYSVSMDYYLNTYGNSLAGAGEYNTGSSWLDCVVDRFETDSHSGHGIAPKAGSTEMHLASGLIENNDLINVGQAIELRHTNTYNMVVRNNRGSGTVAGVANLITFRDGTHDNWVEDNVMTGGYIAIRFTENDGEVGINPGGVNNTVVNFVSNNARYHFEVSAGWGDPGGQALPPTGNQFINSTFYGGLYLMINTPDFGDTNGFVNCIFKNVPTMKTGAGAFAATFTYSTFHGGFSAQAGTGNISADPTFLDVVDFVPTNIALNAAEVQTTFFYDMNMKLRVNYTMGAVEID